MKKTLLITVIALIIALITPCFTSALSQPMDLVTDNADVLTDTEEQALQSKLEKLSKKLKAHIVVATVTDMGNHYSIDNFAEAFYDEKGYGWGDSDSGILLVISIANNTYGQREYYIYAHGEAYDELGESGLIDIEDEILPNLREGEYYDAFKAFADACDDELSFDIAVNLVIALGLGAVIAFVVLHGMKKKLKSVAPKATANDYIRNGSFNLTKDLDLYLYRNVTRTRRQSSNSSSSRGGGSRGGGRGGKF